jgi:hypothetical protein
MITMVTPLSRAHINTHKRPFRCEVEGCPGKTTGFVAMGDLKRHNEAHRRRNGEVTSGLFHCRKLGCPRSDEMGGVGFARKDQLRAHMRRSHSEIPLPPNLLPRTAKISDTPTPAGLYTVSWEGMNQSLAAPDLKKRKQTPVSGLDTKEATKDGEEQVSVQNSPDSAILGVRLY